MLLLSGCGEQYVQTTLAPKSDFGWMIQNLLILIVILAAIVFVVVEGVLIYAIFRFRGRPGAPLPNQVHGNTRLEIAWTIVPVVILVIIAVPTVQTIFAAAEVPTDAMNVRVVGRQWWWEVHYNDLNITSANELVVPVGQKVSIDLESADVIHSFWIPQMGGKRDVVPNHVNNLWFTPEKTGVYYGQCAEYCGTSHANMRFRLVVVTQDEFDNWVKTQQVPATPTTEEAKRGAEVFAQSACVGCHTIDGTAAKGTSGPNLSHVGSRKALAGGIMDNTPENMARWLKDPPGVKPGSLMPNLNLSDSDISALVAYLESLK